MQNYPECKELGQTHFQKWLDVQGSKQESHRSCKNMSENLPTKYMELSLDPFIPKFLA